MNIIDHFSKDCWVNNILEKYLTLLLLDNSNVIEYKNHFTTDKFWTDLNIKNKEEYGFIIFAGSYLHKIISEKKDYKYFTTAHLDNPEQFIVFKIDKPWGSLKHYIRKS